MRKFEAPSVLSGLDVPPGCSCLEIGCGQGMGTMLISKHLECGRLVGLDIDPDMIRLARRNLDRPPRWARGIRLDRIELVCGPAQTTGFEDASFDAVVLFDVLHHIVEWRQALVEVARVLKPGGVFSFEEALIRDSALRFNRIFGHTPFEAQELRGALDAAGLEVRTFRLALRGAMVFCRAVRPA